MAQAGAGVEETSLFPTAPRTAPQDTSQVPLGCQGRVSVSAVAGAAAEQLHYHHQLESFSKEHPNLFSLLLSVPKFKAVPALLCCVALDNISPPGPVLTLGLRYQVGWITQLVINCRCLAGPWGAPFPCPCPGAQGLSGARPCGCRTAARPRRGSRHQGRGAGAPGRAGQLGGKFSFAYFVPSHLAKPVSVTTLCHLQDLSWCRSRHARLLEAKPPRNRDRCFPFFHVLMLKLHFISNLHFPPEAHKMTNMPSYLLELVFFFFFLFKHGFMEATLHARINYLPLMKA